MMPADASMMRSLARQSAIASSMASGESPQSVSKRCLRAGDRASRRRRASVVGTCLTSYPILLVLLSVRAWGWSSLVYLLDDQPHNPGNSGMKGGRVVRERGRLARVNRQTRILSELESMSVRELLSEAQRWTDLDEDAEDAHRRRRSRESKLESLTEIESELEELQGRGANDDDVAVLSLRSRLLTMCFKARWHRTEDGGPPPPP